ncbi:MAG: hypothetical protein A4E55_00948 [Pelotomaculum sp. PtaU1.Bin035]|nr:MAG: hypothetical protein A4E55_00948 [Pelotomaculum sp. PtaU1.Bin035]
MSSSSKKASILGKHIIGYLTKKQTFPDTITKIRFELARGVNPLTGLPGDIALKQELLRRMSENLPFSVIYVKSCKGENSFLGGKRIILFVSKLLSNVMKKYGGETDFLVHIKGDTFIILTEKKRAEALCEHATKCFDHLIAFSELVDRKKSNTLCYSRNSEEKWFPSIFMGIIECGNGDNLKIILRKVDKFKDYAKFTNGSIYIHDTM